MPTLMRAKLQGTLCKDGRWRIVVTLTRLDGAKIKKPLYGKSQTEVQDKAHKLIFESRRMAPDRCTIAQLLDWCQENPWQNLAPKTQEQYAYIGAAIKAKFGKLCVGALTRPMIYTWMRQLEADGKLSSRSVGLRRNVLRVALEQAMNTGIISENPAKGWVYRFSGPRRENAPRIEAQDIMRMAEVQPDERRKLWILTLWETAARPSEASKLTSECLTQTESRWWLRIPGTKTEQARRTVPISDELAQRLLDLGEPWFGYSASDWRYIWEDGQIRLGIRKRSQRSQKAKPETPLPSTYAVRKARIEYWRDQGFTDEVWAYLAGHKDSRLTKMVYDRVTLGRIAAQMEKK